MIKQLIFYVILKEKYQLKIEPLLEMLEKLKNVTFGEGLKIEIYEIKIICRIHKY